MFVVYVLRCQRRGEGLLVVEIGVESRGRLELMAWLKEGEWRRVDSFVQLIYFISFCHRLIYILYLLTYQAIQYRSVNSGFSAFDFEWWCL